MFKLYVFSRSVHSFVETLEAHFEGDGGGGGDEGTEKLIKEKFIGGFKKLSEGFSLFQQVREGINVLIRRKRLLPGLSPWMKFVDHVQPCRSVEVCEAGPCLSLVLLRAAWLADVFGGPLLL